MYVLRVIGYSFLVMFGLSAVAWSQQSVADTGQDAKKISVAPQHLAGALQEFSEQSGLQVAYLSSLAENVSSNGTRGADTTEAALSEILSRTGLEYRFVNSETVAIRVGDTNEPVANNAKRPILLAQVANQDRSPRNATPADRGATGASESDRPVIEEIVVTSQKREQRALDIPMSIGVFDAEDIERQGLDNMVDLSYAAPGMMVQEFGPGRQVVFMRGVGNRVGDSPLTGVYLDEVPVTLGVSSPNDAGQLDLRTTDLERVEVLKGPQGTLYGAGAVSGTIRFITADPLLDRFGFKGNVSAMFTEDGAPSQLASIVVNTPLVDDVFGIRVAATHENNGGWVDRPQAGLSDVNENKLSNVRVKSLWQPTDLLDIKAMIIVNRNHDSNSGGVNHSNPDRTFDLPLDPDRSYPFDDDYELYNVTAAYEFDRASLLSSTSYIDQSATWLYTVDAGPDTSFPGFGSLITTDLDKTGFVQELRLASSGDSLLKWTVGAYYQDVKEHKDKALESAVGVRPDETKGESESWATFVDASYMVSEKLELGIGARYFEEDRTSDRIAPQESTQVGKFDKLTWRLTSLFSLNEHTKLFANVATGFRSGGFNSFDANGEQIPPYGPEELLTYEIGSKMLLQNRKGGLDFALFYSEYSDYLRRGFVFDETTGLFVSTQSNFGDVTIKGAEVSVNVAPTDALRLFLNGTYTDSELVHVDESVTGDGLGVPGDPVDYIPRYSFSVGGELYFSWSDDVPGVFSVNYNYREKVPVVDRSLTPESIPIMWSDDVGLLSARLGVEWTRWSLQLFGENLTNESGSFDPWISYGQAVRNRPRTFGVRVGADFF